MLRFALLILLPLSLGADAPSLDHLFPAGASRGTTNAITLTGKFESWPPRIWMSDPLLRSTTETNKGKISIIVPPETQPGPKLLRLFNDEGASEARVFVVGNNREILDAETNNHFLRPQTLPHFPITINGKLDRSGDVDSFVVSLQAGEYLDATLDAYVLSSKLDAVLRLLTTNGLQLAWNHDFVSLDPRLRWEATSNQSVVLQLFGFPHPANAEVKLTGGDATVYRLHLEKGTGRLPPLMEAGNETNVATLRAPATVTGVIGQGKEEDRFLFAAEKNQHWEAEVEAATCGSPLDAWVKIEDAAGKELARNDDAEGSRDPHLEWKAPESGQFRLVVGSVTHRGGNDYRYRLSLKEAAPDYRANLLSGTLVTAPGTTNQLKINLKRLRGHTNDLRVEVRDLPAGVSAVTTNVSGKSGEISVPLVVSSEATNSQGMIKVFLIDESAKQERVVPLKLTSRTEDNGVPGGFTRLLVEQIDHCWLTVYRKPK